MYERTDERFTIMEMFVPTTGKMPRRDQFRSCPDVTAHSILETLISFQVAIAFVFEKYFYIPCNLSVLNFFIELSRTQNHGRNK